MGKRLYPPFLFCSGLGAHPSKPNVEIAQRNMKMMDGLWSISSGLVLFGAHVNSFVCLCGMIFTCREAVIEHNLLFFHFVVMLCFLQKNFSDVDKVV